MPSSAPRAARPRALRGPAVLAGRAAAGIALTAALALATPPAPAAGDPARPAFRSAPLPLAAGAEALDVRREAAARLSPPGARVEDVRAVADTPVGAVAWIEQAPGAPPQLVVAAGRSNFADTVVLLGDAAARPESFDLAADAMGLVHVVWCAGRDDGAELRYTVVDPTGRSVTITLARAAEPDLLLSPSVAVDRATGLAWMAWLVGAPSFSRVVVAEPLGVGEFRLVEPAGAEAAAAFRAFPSVFLVAGAPVVTWYETDALGALGLRVALREAAPAAPWETFLLEDTPLPVGRFPEIVQWDDDLLTALYRERGEAGEGHGAYRLDLRPGASPRRLDDAGDDVAGAPLSTRAPDAWWIAWPEHDAAGDALRLRREDPPAGAAPALLRLRFPDDGAGPLHARPAFAVRGSLLHLFWIDRRAWGGDGGLFHQLFELPDGP